MKIFTNLNAADKYLGAQNDNEFVRQVLSTSTQIFSEKQKQSQNSKSEDCRTIF